MSSKANQVAEFVVDCLLSNTNYNYKLQLKSVNYFTLVSGLNYIIICISLIMCLIIYYSRLFCMYFLFVFSWRDLWNMCTFILIWSLAYMGCTWCHCLYHHGYWVVLGWLGCCLQVSIFLTSKVIIERLYVLERKHYWHWLSQILTAPWTLLTKHFTTPLFTSWY